MVSLTFFPQMGQEAECHSELLEGGASWQGFDRGGQ